MAGDWIKMGCDLAEDPAVIAIAAKVGMDEIHVVGCLHTIWSWADRQSRDGHAVGVTHAFLDRKARRDGFAQAMCEVSWLELTPTGVVFPNFGRHNGKSAKERALSNKRQKSHRENVTPEVTEVSRQPSRTDRDSTVTREEKRREEKKNKRIIPTDFGISDRVRAWAAEKGHARLDERLEHFVGYAKRSGKSYADWDAAFECAIREDWAKLSGSARVPNGQAAESGWVVVLTAIERGKRPDVWPDPLVPKALDAIGGWVGVKDMRTDDLPHRRREFIKAYGALSAH